MIETDHLMIDPNDVFRSDGSDDKRPPLQAVSA
jgi:hypothetical protein